MFWKPVCFSVFRPLSVPPFLKFRPWTILFCLIPGPLSVILSRDLYFTLLFHLIPVPFLTSYHRTVFSVSSLCPSFNILFQCVSSLDTPLSISSQDFIFHPSSRPLFYNFIPAFLFIISSHNSSIFHLIKGQFFFLILEPICSHLDSGLFCFISSQYLYFFSSSDFSSPIWTQDLFFFSPLDLPFIISVKNFFLHIMREPHFLFLLF